MIWRNYLILMYCLVKNLKSQSRKILSSFLYEIHRGFFVGKVNYKFSQDFIKYINGCKLPEKAIVIIENKVTYEGFDIYYINCKSKVVNMDGNIFFESS